MDGYLRNWLRIIKVAATAYVALQFKNLTEEFQPKIEISQGDKLRLEEKVTEFKLGPIEYSNTVKTIEKPVNCTRLPILKNSLYFSNIGPSPLRDIIKNLCDSNNPVRMATPKSRVT